MKELSRTMTAVPNSAIRKIFNLCIGVDDLVKFTVGEPDFITAPNIIEASHRSLLRGETKYTSNRGNIELRRAISKMVRQKKHVDYDPETEIMVTIGGMEALFMAMKSICNPGDEIIIGAPYFTNYLGQALMNEVKPVFVQLHEKDDFVFNLADLEAAITGRTKIILLNSPSNPLGSIIDPKTMERIADLAKKHDLYVISDEVYQDYIYDEGDEFCSIASFPGMKERTVIVDSFSKAYAMTGWRIGYGAAPAAIVDLMVKQQEGMASCVNSPAQAAALEALEGPQDYYTDMIQAFKKRRDLLMAELSKVDKLSFRKPKGAFYLFVNISKTGLSSEEFALRMLDEAGVAVIPGSGFGPEGEGYVRISYVVSEEDILKGAQRIKSFVGSL